MFVLVDVSERRSKGSSPILTLSGDTVPEESTEKRGLSRGERSHLIVWQVPIIRKRRTKK